MQIVNIPNSMTVLPELLPLSIEMVCLDCLHFASRHLLRSAIPAASLHAGFTQAACSGLCRRHALHLICLSGSCVQAQRGLTGIMNFTNPGAVSHNEIMDMYKQYIDKDFTWSNFTIEEQAKVIKAPRSNNLLDTQRVCPTLHI